jgi:hypothetical protein
MAVSRGQWVAFSFVREYPCSSFAVAVVVQSKPSLVAHRVKLAWVEWLCMVLFSDRWPGGGGGVQANVAMAAGIFEAGVAAGVDAAEIADAADAAGFAGTVAAAGVAGFGALSASWIRILLQSLAEEQQVS